MDFIESEDKLEEEFAEEDYDMKLYEDEGISWETEYEIKNFNLKELLKEF